VYEKIGTINVIVMSILIFTVILVIGSFCAGLVGSLTGLGGGVILIPLLTLLLGVDIRYAIGTSLIASIATSSGAAAAYLKEGITNVRIGMFLEIATTTGAIVGTLIALFIPTHVVAIIFGIVLLFSAIMGLRKKVDHIEPQKGGLAEKLRLGGSYPTPNGEVNYGVRNVGGGYFIMTLAGILSGILGIGSGAVKVLAMDTMMHIPFKVSTTTSNFMVGVTTATGAVVYLQRGYIDPGLAMPALIGVLGGSMLGARILMKTSVQKLRVFFSIIIGILACEMLYNGIMKNI
jgi:hypothetical protein